MQAQRQRNATYSSSGFLPSLLSPAEVRPGPARHEQVDGGDGGGVGRGEVEREVLGQRLDGGLARVVGRVARRVRDALKNKLETLFVALPRVGFDLPACSP